MTKKKKYDWVDWLMEYGLAILIVIAVVGALFYFGLFDKDRELSGNNEEEILKELSILEPVKHCLEWDGFIKRENLFFNCYSVKTQEWVCDYKITKDQNLVVKVFEDDSERHFNCTEYITSTRVI